MGSSETGRTRVAATDGRVSIEIRQRITSRMNFDRGVFTQAWWGTQRRRVIPGMAGPPEEERRREKTSPRATTLNCYQVSSGRLSVSN